MNYKERFEPRYIKADTFRGEDKMLEFINENLDTIEIIQVYTTQYNTSTMSYQPRTRFHLMYKLNPIEEKVMI